MTDIPVNRMPPVHPGEILREDVLAPLGMSVNALALALRVPQNRMAEIVAGRRGITGDTALRLARYLGTTPDFWVRLQADYDLKVAAGAHGPEIMRQVLPREPQPAAAEHGRTEKGRGRSVVKQRGSWLRRVPGSLAEMPLVEPKWLDRTLHEMCSGFRMFRIDEVIR